MDVRAYEDPDTFEAAIGKLYSADPVRHTVAVGAIARLLHDPAVEPVMLTVHSAGELCGAALRTPPWPLIVSALPVAAAEPAADLLVTLDPGLPGVSGPREAAEEFARAWRARTGAGVREVMATRLFELGDLREPTVPGHGRAGTGDDLPLLVRWRREFQAEAFGHLRNVDGIEDVIRRGLAAGERWEIWEDGGEPVACAHSALPADGMSRVGPVYTEPGRRGRGYGSAVTAAASRWARAAGAAHVLIMTDLANPTSNSIYQKLGYRPVSDACELEFTPAS